MWRERQFSVKRAVSLRIQNTRSHIPLCLQFLYTAEGNKGTTVIWLQYHGAPRWWETSQPMWHCDLDNMELNLLLENSHLAGWMFSVLWMKRPTENDETAKSSSYPLFCILKLFYSSYWCSFIHSALQEMKLATWEMMFSVIQKT